MPAPEVTQLVAFTTDLPPDRFLPRWQPFAAGFLQAGLRTITLAGFGGDSGFAYVSRNTWPAADYRRAFPSGLAADGAAGPVSVRQAGVYSVHPASGEPVAEARPDLDLTLALVAVPDPARIADVVAAALASASAGDVVAYRAESPAQRYQVAVTVHGPAGTGTADADALRAAFEASPVARPMILSGRELLTLTS